jgi:hypothetical protein
VLLDERPFPQPCREVRPGRAADMSTDNASAPYTPMPVPPSIVSLALLTFCGFCWAEPSMPCTDDGQHYARYLQVYYCGVLDAAGLATVCRAAPYITVGAIVPEACNPSVGPQERL